MGLKLGDCDDSDMTDAFAIISSALGHEHPYHDYVFPNHDTTPGRKVGGERLLAIKTSDPNTRFLKVTDMDTGEIIAVAKWNIYDGVVPDEIELDGDFWATSEDKEYAKYLFRGYLVPRREAIKRSGGHLVCKSITR
ncbi:MAG: hypothetical protein Q9211_001503 [Gyalolechia sp. 1 TL-2023]